MCITRNIMAILVHRKPIEVTRKRYNRFYKSLNLSYGIVSHSAEQWAVDMGVFSLATAKCADLGEFSLVHYIATSSRGEEERYPDRPP